MLRESGGGPRDCLLGFLRGVDALIIDSQYTKEEYETHRGWGHGCVDEVVSIAVEAGVAELFLFHHDPDHDDQQMSEMEAHARRLVAAKGSPMKVEAAREGSSYCLRRSG